MNFPAKSSRVQIALVILLGYLVLVLHPLIGHTDLFGSVVRHRSLTSHTKVIATATPSQGECSLCQMAGSLTPVTALAAPVTIFLGVPQPVFINIANPTAPIVPGLGFPRAPPTIG